MGNHFKGHSMEQKIAVIGAGIIGLTSALRLLEKNFVVAVFARDFMNGLASRAASAVCIPYKALPLDSVLKWAHQSLRVFPTLGPACGIQYRDIVEYTKEASIPVWAQLMGQHRDLHADVLPAPYTHGFSSKMPIIDSSLFIDFLIARIKALGGVIIKKAFNTLEDVNPNFNIIINCSGVGANQLVPDEKVFPIRGQYMLIDKPAGLEKITLAHIDENNYILIVPRTNDCWLGGNAINNNWDMTPDPAFSLTLLKWAENVEPLLKNANVRYTGVGLRPGRDVIRLATERIPDGRSVIHNYGHAGAGFITSFGCADEVVELAQNL
jgi:D-amino-acid oxidase